MRRYDILDLLLRRWDTIPDKGGQTLTAAMGRPDWDSRNIVSLLDQLSYEAHRDATSDDGRGRLPRYAVQGRLSDHMQAQGMGRGEAGSAALHCLDYIEQRSGLLVPDENDSYVFAHLTLQEHCAGRHIALNSEDPIGLIMQHRHDDRWREPIFLGMGLADPLYLNELLNELVDRDEPEQPKPVERWYRDLILAAELGKDRDWHYLQTQPRVKVKRLQASLRAGLVELLNDATQPLPAAERVRAGFLLGDLGDPRFPVTIEEWKAEAEKVLSGDTSGYFCKVEPGTYLIGSSDDNPDAEDEEEPQHTVTFDRPFWIARYPITKVQYIGWETRQESEGATSDLISPIRLSSNQPIEVSKWLAINFCSWIGFQIQENVRLPTHEEWIAVIRGVNNTRYSWGDNWNENCISDNRPLNTVPVGCFPKGASHCGAMDMLGTVFEWTVGETRAITSSELLALKETPSSFSGFRIVLAPLDSTTTYEDD